MGKRKYRLLPPGQVAESAWSELTNSERISKMKDNYVKKMDELPRNEDAKGRYTKGVSNWTTVMRTAEIRETISSAVQKAKRQFFKLMFPTAT